MKVYAGPAAQRPAVILDRIDPADFKEDLSLFTFNFQLSPFLFFPFRCWFNPTCVDLAWIMFSSLLFTFHG